MFSNFKFWQLLFAILVSKSLLLSALENDLARKPPMGWISWQRFACQTDCAKKPNDCIGETLIKSIANKMIDHELVDLGYSYVNIDDCWSEMQRNSSDERLVAHHTGFPNGIKPLAEFTHSLNLKLGLYGDCGSATCQGYPAQLKQNSDGDYFDLDASTLFDWDVDSFKLDGCNVDVVEAQQRCPLFSTSLQKKYEQSKKRPVLLTCEWPVYLIHAGKSNLVDWKLAADSCNVIRFTDDVLDEWARVLYIVDQAIRWQSTLLELHGPGSWFDPDMLMIGNFGLSQSEEEAQMALWSIWSAPLFMSNDLRDIRESSLTILKNRNLISVNQDELGVFGLMVKSEQLSQAFLKPVLPIVDNCPSFVVVYLNRDALGNYKKIEFDMKDLLINDKLILQAHINSQRVKTYALKTNSTQDLKSIDFDANKCIESLKDAAEGKETKSYKVYDLLASSTGPVLLNEVSLESALGLMVSPSGVRAIKLELVVGN